MSMTPSNSPPTGARPEWKSAARRTTTTANARDRTSIPMATSSASAHRSPPDRRETRSRSGTVRFTRRLIVPTTIGRDDVRRLIAEGAQLVEVLPRAEYDEEHLPG